MKKIVIELIVPEELTVLSVLSTLEEGVEAYIDSRGYHVTGFRADFSEEESVLNAIRQASDAELATTKGNA